MRKYLLALAAGLLAASLAAPSYAQDFKYTGVYRLRGITADDLDRNKLAHDGQQYYDSLMRPRFTATSEGGKIVAIYELDFVTGGNFVWGSTTGRPAAGTNRWYFDFAVPGTTLRMKIGKDDYTDPTREIFDSIGAHRQHGIALYGKLMGPVELSAFTTKIADSVGTASGTALAAAANDQDNYYIALKWQAAPQIAITPWAALNWRNSANGAATAAAGTGFEVYYLALHAQAKVGILDLVVQGILETGNAANPPNHIGGAGIANTRLGGARDVDLEAWALMVRSWLTFGKLQIGLYLTVLTGDDDQVTATGNQAQQRDRQLTRFVYPSGDTAGYLEGPNILTGRRWSTITANNASGLNTTSNQRGIGTGSNNFPNGLIMPEVLLRYQLTPDLKLEGGVSFVRSAKKAADIGATLTGPSTAATTFDNAKNFGTAFEAGFRWNVYKQLVLVMVGSYLASGDYGKVQTGKAKDDAWGIYYEFLHTW